MKKGDRVQVTDRITPGVGSVPKPGDKGDVEAQLENGTVIVKLDDGRRAQLASWEVEPIPPCRVCGGYGQVRAESGPPFLMIPCWGCKGDRRERS